jgi:hypothetical protein
MTFTNIDTNNPNFNAQTEDNVYTDSNGAQYALFYQKVNDIDLETRVYAKTVRFTAIVPINGWDKCRLLLDLKVPADMYMEDPESFINCAYYQAKQKAWWMNDQQQDNIYHDSKGVPFTEETHEVGVVENALPGETHQVKVRFRFYPKSVRPLLIFIKKEIMLSFGMPYRGEHTELLDSIYLDKFVLSQVLGGIRKSLRSKGFDLTY